MLNQLGASIVSLCRLKHEMLLEVRQKCVIGMERVMGIEPTYAAWEAAVLPLNYTRAMGYRSRDVIVECFKDGDNKDFTPSR